MPPFIRRRKRGGPPEPNKNEKKILRHQETERLKRCADLLGDVFPSVLRLSIQLDFITPQQHPLERSSRVFSPAETCDFLVPCPGRCGGEGSFDLTDKIKFVIQSHQQSAEETAICQEAIAIGSDACSLQLRCKIEVAYQ